MFSLEMYHKMGIEVLLLKPNNQYPRFNTGSKIRIHAANFRGVKGKTQIWLHGSETYHQSFKTEDFFQYVDVPSGDEKDFIMKFLNLPK